MSESEEWRNAWVIVSSRGQYAMVHETPDSKGYRATGFVWRHWCLPQFISLGWFNRKEAAQKAARAHIRFWGE